jgi:hypothetical protein
MVIQERSIERRKEKRLAVEIGAFASISPNSNKLGQIIDISMGGLCFKYMSGDDEKWEENRTEDETLFLSSKGFYIGELSFKTIADYEVEDRSSLGFMKSRKRHVQFTDLSFKQLFDLEYYIRSNTKGRIGEPEHL